MSEPLYLLGVEIALHQTALCSFQIVVCVGHKTKVIFLELCSIGIIAASVVLFFVFSIS